MKYNKIVKNNLLATFEYRSALVVDSLLDLIQTAGFIFLWIGIYSFNDAFKEQYSLNEMIFYYCLIPLIGIVTAVHLDAQSEDIRSGNFSSTLLKPYSFVKASFAQSLGAKISTLVVLMPVYVIVILALSRFFELTLTPAFIFIGILASLSGFLLNFFVDITINFSAFWIDDSWFFRHLRNFLYGLFGGVTFPIAMAPEWLHKIIEFLPFKFMYYVPVAYMQGIRSVADFLFKDFVMLIAWILVFFVLSSFIWRLGIKKYSAHGG